MKVLLADDEKILRIPLADEIEAAGHAVTAVADGDAALAALAADPYDCVITDLAMPGADGHAVLAAARERGMDVVVITGAGDVDDAVAAMKAGAYDFLRKPFLNDEVIVLLERLAELRGLRQEVADLRHGGARHGLARVVGSSPALQPVLDRARAVARSDAGVLIVGESGVGKEVLARAVHEESARADQPFVPIAGGVLAGTLLESELFGHEKGAFTGADARRVGRFEQAAGGTVFLDDIDDMPLATQVKLLRVLQEHTVERLGGGPVEVDIRVVAATKEDLAPLVRAGRFREDLYYRLNVITLTLPPLRERPEDVAELATYFLARHGGERDLAFAPATLAALRRHDWPGNIRELENAVLRGATLLPPGATAIEPEHLFPAGAVPDAVDAVAPASAQGTGAATGDDDGAGTLRTLADAVEAAERSAIRSALAATGGHRGRTAERLGISRKHLWDKMKRLGIDPPADTGGD